MPNLTGPLTPCAGSAGNVYLTDPGQTGYIWLVSSGGSITGGAGTSSITVTWNTAGPQTVSVYYDLATDTTVLDVSVQVSFPVDVTIIASANPVCNGSQVTFTATPVNGGSTPGYQWMVNNIGTGPDSPVFSYSPANGDVVTCQVSSSLTCVTGNPATSNAITMDVTPTYPVSISITASSNPACAGNMVVYTATTVNPGNSPFFQWKVNGSNSGGNAPTFSYQPVNGDIVTCVLTSSEICPGGNPATSNAINMIVSQNLPVSVMIAASENPSCTGNLVTFTATPSNGGPAPFYNWLINGISNGINSPAFSYMPDPDDVVTCILTSSAGCASGNPATSNAITMTVAQYAPVSVSISASANPACNGTQVTLTAFPVNGGTAPAYQWFLNSTPTSTNSTYTLYPANGDVITCMLNSNALCTTGNPANSNVINMVVSPSGSPGVSIVASNNPACQGTLVTFTATATNAGTSPAYQWKVNGVNAGTNNPVFAYIPVNGEVVTCSITSNSLCSFGTVVLSNSITMSVSPVQPVSISITAQSNPVCQGSTVIFTATVMNGGTAPVYQWQVNGTPAGTNSPTYSYEPSNNDIVTCIYTSNALCTTGNPATSNAITMVVSASMPASVSITASANPSCTGVPVMFIATPVNGGTDPVFEWRRFGFPVGSNDTLIYTPGNGDVFTCILNSNNGCPPVNNATSNPITMTVDPMLPVSVSITASANPSCLGAFITFTATPVNGGVAPAYQWKVNGGDVGTNQGTYTYSPVNGDVITCILTSGIPCGSGNPATSNAVTMTVHPILSPTINVTTPEDTVCPGTNVTFTAHITNGGASPLYQWKLNGTNFGPSTSNPLLTYVPLNGDRISCMLTLIEQCVNVNPVTSAELIIHTNSPLPGSISINASANPFCQGATVFFTSSSHNGGATPSYQWKVNGVNAGGNSPTYAYGPANGDFVTCTLTSSLTCTTGPVTSNPILMIMKTNVPASISITASVNPVCVANPVTFSSVIQNGGTSPSYQWQVDGADMPGATNSGYTYVPSDGDIVTCELTSNAVCVSGSPVISSAVVMGVFPALPASVTISTTTNPFCQGQAVTFHASSSNGGTAPVYIWKVNGTPAGGPASTFIHNTPADGDVVTCELTTNSTCFNGTNPVPSNAITLTETTSLTASMFISASANPVCQGTSVTFLAVPTNGGTVPQYQWQVNAVDQPGATNNSYTYVPANGDIVTCLLTTDLTCTTQSTVVSNAVTMTVSSTVMPSVSITASQNPVCVGTLVTFTATPANGGPSPTYIWRRNGIAGSGTTNSTYSIIPANYETIVCQLISDAQCNSGIPVISNQITMAVNAEQPVGIIINTPTLSFCAGTSVTFTSSTVNGGTSPAYQWKVNGFNGTGIATNATYTYAPISGDVVTCVLTSSQSCINNNPATSNSLVMTAGTGFPVSVTISANINPICYGNRVIFTAVPENGGVPHYQWQVNGVNAGSNLDIYEYNPYFNDVVRCILTSSLTTCVINNPDTSNQINMIVNPRDSVSVMVTASANPSCQGSTICFFASVTNGGSSPRYRWYVNNTYVSQNVNTPTYCYIPQNGDIVSCQVKSNLLCPTPPTCPSNNITMVVLPISQAEVSISASANPVCAGTVVTYQATPVNGGTSPLYEWQVNGSLAPGSTNNAIYSYPPANTDVVTNQMTSNALCVSTNTVTSNPVPMTVNSYSPVSVTIVAAENPVCQGLPVTFAATPVNGGSLPSYQWMVNGSNAGMNSPIFTFVPADGNIVTCRLTSNIACTTGSPAMSNAVTVSVMQSVPVSISITASATPTCQGEAITYTATALNGGLNPQYQWLVNGMIVGTNSPIYTFVPSSGDVVACQLTSNAECPQGNPALSNAISMNFPPYLPVSISITCSANPTCLGTPVTFLANAVNGGTSPVYQWAINGAAAGGNQPDLIYSPADGDIVTCGLISDIPCPVNNPAMSNSLTMSVLTPLAASITLSVSANPVCSGYPVTFTAHTTNSGSSPAYQWIRNGFNTGTGLPTYTYLPGDGDQISCRLISSMSCITNNPVTSDTVTMIVASSFPASVSISASGNPTCDGQPVTFTASPVNGGIDPFYRWSVNGIEVIATTNPTYTYTPSQGDVVSCELTSSFICATGSPAESNHITMTVSPILPVSITITCSSNPACLGIPVTFTANPVNGGPSPVFQWKINGADAGTGLSTFTYAPANGDQVTCRLTSSQNCIQNVTALSNPIGMIIGSSFAAGVTIIASDNPICEFTPVTFTATPAFGGPSPSYQWYVNSSPVGANSTVYTCFPSNGDVVTCVMTSQLTCATGNPATSNPVTIVVLPIPVSVTIAVNTTWPVCAGTLATYTAFPVNGGPSPTFQWRVNGSPAGTNNISFTYPPADGDTVTCTLMSNATCASGNTVTSLPIIAQVNPVLPVSINITPAQGNTVCSGTIVTYNATFVNPGTAPLFQWRVNGGDIAGATNTSYQYEPANNDAVTCILTSNATCPGGNPATSNAVLMTVNPLQPVSISIAEDNNPVCEGTTVTYTASPVNEGTAPIYAWFVNGVLQVGQTGLTFSHNPLNNDQVYATLTSNATCATGNPANSNTVTIIVNPVQAVSVSISADINPACAGNQVICTANPVNGGPTAVFAWYVNGVLQAGETTTTFTYTPVNNDQVYSVLTSNEACSTGSPATSDTITMIVNPLQPVSLSITENNNPVCAGTTVTYTASPVNEGGAPVYAWYVNGALQVGQTGLTFSYIPANIDQIYSTLTSNATCATGSPATSNTISMIVNPLQPVSLSITENNNPVCAGTTVTYTASPVNEGGAPVYAWYVNGALQVGQTGLTFSNIPANNDQVYSTLTSNATCATGSPATSNTVTMTVNALQPVSLFITENNNPVCAGTTVTYTASPVNEGGTPVYAWYVNGALQAGQTGPVFSYIPANNDQVYSTLTSNATCATGSPATSNTITMTVNPLLPVSISIAEDKNPVCAGTMVTCTTSEINGGTAPVFAWYVNGMLQAGQTGTTFSFIPANNDQVYSTLTSNATCATGSPATSNTITLTVNPLQPVSLLITENNNPVCAGTTVTYTASPVNEGGAPVYAWYVNGALQVGQTGPIFSHIPANNDQVYSTLTSNATCATGSPATSNTVVMTVNPLLPVSVSITENNNSVCAGTMVTFTASPVNEGATPVYAWYVNGALQAGQTGPVFSYSPANNDQVYSTLTSNATCATGSPATSNTVTMAVNPVLSAGVTIAASVNPVCEGSTVTFTANPVNGGTAPLYEWRINGAPGAGTTNSSYSFIPVNNDEVTCILTSSDACSTGNPATSNPVVMVVDPVLPVGISLAATPSAAICEGTFVTFTATVTNGGTNPVYQWMVNGSIAGSNAPTYGYIPLIGDVVSCELTSNVTCGINNPATDTITVLLSPSPVVSFSVCNDNKTRVDAQPLKLKGGLPLNGTYSGPGVIAGVFDPAAAGAGLHQVTYTYTNAGGCTATSSLTIEVQGPDPLICGNPVTDIRDGKVYQTVQIGAQCWFADNLNYGTMKNSGSPLADNCVNEKYCLNDVIANCTQFGGLYAWDELMQYSTVAGSQGLCPPGWHVPDDAEWTALFSFYAGQAVAATSLKDQAPGMFNALPDGLLYQNNTWSFYPPEFSATFFWTSETAGPTRARSHGLNSRVNSVSDYQSGRENAFSVRCIRD